MSQVVEDCLSCIPVSPDFQLSLACGTHWPGIREWVEKRGQMVQRRSGGGRDYSKGSISFVHSPLSRQAHHGSIIH